MFMERNIAKEVLENNRFFEGSKHLVDIEGLSTPKVCNLLNQLVKKMHPQESYLEIGTWKGLTLFSAALNNHGKNCIGCDKFRFYGQFTGWGFLAKKAMNENIRRFMPRSATIRFHHMKSEELFDRKLVKAPVGIYFYDGDHSFNGTRDNLISAFPLLSKKSVLLVDDWNDPVIRGATFCALKDQNIEVLWQQELAGNHSQDGWWNGLGVFYIQKK